MPRDACGVVVMEVTSRAMAAEPGASSLHGVAVDPEDGDGHFWDGCSDDADVRDRASIDSTERSRQAPIAALPYESNTQEAARSSRQQSSQAVIPDGCLAGRTVIEAHGHRRVGNDDGIATAFTSTPSGARSAFQSAAALIDKLS